MTEHATTVEDALASEYDDYAVGERLHDVPPHRVHAVTVAGRRAVCKVATGPQAHLRRDAQVLEHVDRETSLPVPAVLAAGEGFYVAGWLDEVPDEGGHGGAPSRQAWARVAGAGLATLHAETTFDVHGPLRAGADGLGVDGHETAAAGLAGYLADLRPGVAEAGHGDVVDDAVAFLRAHRGAFAGAGDPVLCHGNWLPDHVGVDGGAVAAVIDFERAMAAPAEHDYWRATIPLFAGTDRDAPVRTAFREGYESVRPLPDGFEDRAPVHRLVIAASFVESLVVQDQHDPAETERRAAALRSRVDELLAAHRTTG